MTKSAKIVATIIISFATTIFNGCDLIWPYEELYKKTDKFVESLQTTYQFYGLMEGAGHKEVTSDGVYQVAPMGRMILVKILKNAGNDKYKELKDALKSHYEGDKRVNDVFINNGGTVTIDCRD